MITLEQARERILGVIPPARGEKISLAEANHRFVLEDIQAAIDLPPFDNSAMDGFALIAADIQTASAQAPVRLRVRDRIPAGAHAHAPITTGTCARVFTGSTLPPGADAVVMQEDTKIDPAQADQVLVMDAVKSWENVRLRGEDIRRGAAVAKPGTRIEAGLAALLAALGQHQVTVATQPSVGLLATGNELLEPGASLIPGKIYESNRLALGLLTARAGGRPRTYPIIPDQLETTQTALQQALNECDLLITTGGVSVGELDLVKDAFTKLGGQLDFWRVAIKPGRPFVFGQWKDKYLFGLPGNPVSALVTFLVLVRPAILQWQGALDLGLPAQNGTLTSPLRNEGDRRHFMRVRVDDQGQVHSTGTQASHMLHSLALSNGLVDVPPQTNLAPNTSVRVLRWDWEG